MFAQSSQIPGIPSSSLESAFKLSGSLLFSFLLHTSQVFRFVFALRHHKVGILLEYNHLDRAQWLGGLLERIVLYFDGQYCIFGLLWIYTSWGVYESMR